MLSPVFVRTTDNQGCLSSVCFLPVNTSDAPEQQPGALIQEGGVDRYINPWAIHQRRFAADAWFYTAFFPQSVANHGPLEILTKRAKVERIETPTANPNITHSHYTLNEAHFRKLRKLEASIDRLDRLLADMVGN